MGNLVPVRALDLLDQHLYGKLSPVAKQEAVKGINQAYNQLSFRRSPVTYYESPQIRGVVDPDGQVGFLRNYPELAMESYRSPEELIQGIKSGDYNQDDIYDDFFGVDPTKNAKRLEILEAYLQKPKPTKELVAMSRAFNELAENPEGQRLYYNTPISEHRAKAYSKQGFESVPIIDENGKQKKIQLLDKRPFADQEMVNKLYAYGDAQRYGDLAALALLNQRTQLPITDINYVINAASPF